MAEIDGNHGSLSMVPRALLLVLMVLTFKRIESLTGGSGTGGSNPNPNPQGSDLF